MINYGLQFDGIQNYVSLGTLGSLGSSLGSGFYCSFNMKTSSTSQGRFGYSIDNFGVTSGSVNIALNASEMFATVAGKIAVEFEDNNYNYLVGGTTSTTTFNDGNFHTIEITANFTSKTITIKIDGISQTITYHLQQTLSTFSNFSQNFCLGADTYLGTVTDFFACILDNFKIGTSQGSLYGSYVFDEGKGTTANDSSGNTNTGTLSGSPVPLWILLGAPQTDAQVHKEALMRNVTGSSAQTPIGQLERVYYISQSGITGNSRMDQKLETLRKIIVANGGTPQGRRESDLVKQALSAKGLPVSKSLRQNWRTLELSL